MLLVNGKKQENLPVLKKAVEFELVGGYTFEDPNLVTPQGVKYVRRNKELKLPTTYVAFDQASNQNVEYRYAARELPFSDKNGIMQKKYTPDRIVFSGTKLICQITHPDLYEFLTKSPWLEKLGNAKAIFREVNHQAVSQSRLDMEKRMTKAKSMILDDDRALPEVTLRRILTSTGGDGDTLDIEVVKDKLLTIADKEPDRFLKLIAANGGSTDNNIPNKPSDRLEKEARLKELGDLLVDHNLKKGFHLMAEAKLDEKIKEAEARWKKEEEFQNIVKSGDSMMAEEKFEEAKGFFTDAVKLRPEDKKVAEKLNSATKKLVPA